MCRSKKKRKNQAGRRAAPPRCNWPLRRLATFEINKRAMDKNMAPTKAGENYEREQAARASHFAVGERKRTTVSRCTFRTVEKVKSG